MRKFISLMSITALAACSAGPTQTPLAQAIATDPLMTQVDSMAHVIMQGGFNAGDGYGEVWIRDYNTFIELSMDVMPDSLIQDNLLTFFRFQGEGGDIVDGFIDKDKAFDEQSRLSVLEPRYSAHKNTVETDQEASLVQAVWRYVNKSGNTDFLKVEIDGKSVLQRLEWALDYLTRERWDETHGLIWGATTADWGDVQPEHPWGVDMDQNTHRALDIYDNAFFIIAINHLLDMGGNQIDRERWTNLRETVKTNVRTYLWDNERQKFRPHVYLGESPFPADLDEDAIYYHGGTAVAIEAGLLSHDEIAAQNQAMLANVKASGAPTIGLTVYPPYPEGTFQNKGMYPYGYQNGGDWTWFGARMITQLALNGFVQEAYDELQPMLQRVVDNQGFNEWYARDGKAMGSGTFRGEAGVLYTAIQTLRKVAK